VKYDHYFLLIRDIQWLIVYGSIAAVKPTPNEVEPRPRFGLPFGGANCVGDSSAAVALLLLALANWPFSCCCCISQSPLGRSGEAPSLPLRSPDSFHPPLPFFFATLPTAALRAVVAD